jgi:hypothetical protein
MIGAGQLTQHERVKAIGLPARHTKPIARRRHLVGMQGQHPQPRVQQPLHQQPVRSLDRHQLNLQPQQAAGRTSSPTKGIVSKHD